MSIILKPLFDILIGDVAVMDNVLYNYLIMLVVGEIAFRFAFSLVGDAYDIGLISGKSAGSILHWIIRLVIYVVIAYLLRGGIWLYIFVIGVPHWVWWTLVGIVVTTMILVIVFRYAREKRASENEPADKETN
jgi:hypothetical protein